MKKIIQKQTVSAVQGEARRKNLSRRELADFRLAVRLPRFIRHEPDGEELRGLERLERGAQVALDEHVERAVEQEFTQPVDERQRQAGDLLFGVSGLLPLADVAGKGASGGGLCPGGGRKEKIFAGLARLGFELEVGQLVTL